LGLDALKIIGLECDVSSEVSVADAFMRTVEEFGRVDAVVASAGKFVCRLGLCPNHYLTDRE
jgi:NAD(P)-dependent dehydrogenase (short-subunit alcohol dehydrogenase family)